LGLLLVALGDGWLLSRLGFIPMVDWSISAEIPVGGRPRIDKG
jgi:hypothetical protein